MKRVWTCNDHSGYWPVGAASVIVAETEDAARALLDIALIAKRLKPHAEVPYTLKELATDAPHVEVLLDGEY